MTPKISPSEKIEIELNIGDQLTSISCGHIVVELIKFLAYQRLQIPYTYQWLKQVINKKKEGQTERKESYQSERHFHIASTALNNLDFVLKVHSTFLNWLNLQSLSKEIEGASQPQEVCIAFGATPVSCKEIYRVILPLVCHKPQCHSIHIASDKKIQSSVFRNLVTCEKLSQVFFETLSPMNMYVFLKKVPINHKHVICNDSFVLVNGYRIPRSCKVIVLNFKSSNIENTNCCNDFQVFGDALSQELAQVNILNGNDNSFDEIESTDEVKWFQSTYVMKGFKDCVVNGSSITNTWLQC